MSKDYKNCNIKFENYLVMVVDYNHVEILVLNSQIKIWDRMTNHVVNCKKLDPASLHYHKPC